MRNIACAQAMRSRKKSGLFYHPENPLPWKTPSEELDDKEHALDHFFGKLLKLNAGMHTEIAKQEANKRHEWMTNFLLETERELQ